MREDNMPTLSPHARADQAEKIRIHAAKTEKHVVTHHDNGDEALYPGRWGNYSKGLQHDARGDVVPSSYDSMLGALQTGTPADFEAIALGGDVPLVNPQAGLAYVLEGRDPQALLLPPAPKLASAWRGGGGLLDGIVARRAVQPVRYRSAGAGGDR
jgi:hypothetical protein